MDDRTRASISQAIDEAALALSQAGDVELAMRDLVQAARNSVPDFDHASITLMHADGRFETGSSTSRLSRDLDAAQYAAGEGPCLDAVRHGHPVSVSDLRSEHRWPAYVAAAVVRGVRSHLSVTLRLPGNHTAAGLNLYSTTTDHVSLESRAMAGLFS